jgi:hypothetical protein
MRSSLCVSFRSSPTQTHCSQEHPFLVADAEREVNMIAWVAGALGRREIQAQLRAQSMEMANEPVSV